MKVIGIIGWKNSGKTFFAQRIIKKLTQKGINVASIKRADHNFDIDTPNTDSYLHRKAGSKQVIVSSSKRWAKITELDNKKEKRLEELLKELDNTDIVIVEGFKKELHKKIEIINQLNENYLFNEIENVIAVVSNSKLNTNLPLFKKNEIDLIVNFILKY
jgi:molybdopterin-guanine dinucleotide biosynthesis protein B